MEQEAGTTPPDSKRKRLIPPCVRACPAGVDVPRYIGYLEQGRFDEAEAVVRERIPLAAVCGRVCYRPCEPMCRRGLLDAPVQINALKRAATEYSSGRVWRERWQDSIAPDSGRRVAVIGAGPAGLTAAYYLGKVCGHEVTVFEAAPAAGGQLYVGIPEFRLPKIVLRRELELICETRVKLLCNHRVESLDDLTAQGFDAVFISMGTWKSNPLDIPGVDLPAVMDGVAFLREANLGRLTGVGDRVRVIGGGNVAIDAARVAVRLGARDVGILYRRSRREMPALEHETQEAEAEGMHLDFLVSPIAVEMIPDGRLRLHLQEMELGEPDESGRRRPVPIPEAVRVELVNNVLLAIGQQADIREEWGLGLRTGGILRVDPETLETDRQGVFAGGDVATGPLSVIAAIGQGRLAAQSIDRYLGGDGDISETLAPSDGAMDFPSLMHPQGVAPFHMARLGMQERLRSFTEVDLGLTTGQAMEEARRCLRCDLWQMRGVPEAWRKGQRRGSKPA